MGEIGVRGGEFSCLLEDVSESVACATVADEDGRLPRSAVEECVESVTAFVLALRPLEWWEPVLEAEPFLSRSDFIECGILVDELTDLFDVPTVLEPLPAGLHAGACFFCVELVVVDDVADFEPCFVPTGEVARLDARLELRPRTGGKGRASSGWSLNRLMMSWSEGVDLRRDKEVEGVCSLGGGFLLGFALTERSVRLAPLI